MSKQKVGLTISVALVVFCSAFWAAAQEKSKIKTETKMVTKEELIKIQIEQDRAEATPAQTLTLTPQQKEHRKLYKMYSQPGRRLHDCPATGNRDIVMEIGSGSEVLDDPNPIDIRQILKKMAADADVVMIGVVKDKSSQFTDGEDFIFTDYEIQCDAVLKDFPTAPLNKNERIIVTRPGGIILKNGHLNKVVDENFLLLHKGLQYLLFLKHIPSTGAYQALDSKSSFLLLDNKVSKLTKGDFPIENYLPRNAAKASPAGESIVEATSFLELVRSAINSASNGNN